MLTLATVEITKQKGGEMVESFADRIRQLRVIRNMTQEQLAAACGVTKSAVSQWELGNTKNVRLEAFLRLCDALGTDPHYLLYGPDRGHRGNKKAG